MLSNSKKWIKGLRLIVAFAAYGFVALKLYQQGTDNILSELNGTVFFKHWYVLFIAIGLMPLAWGIEAYKWKLALIGVERISFFDAWKSVWYGVVAGFLTPNRIGEPFGRMAFVEAKNRGKATLLGIWCGISQQLATLIFGFIGLFYWIFSAKENLEISFWNSYYLIFIIFAIGIAILVFISIGGISSKLQKIAPLRRVLSGETLSITTGPKKSIYVLLLSLVRYSIFSSQLVLFLHFFGVNDEIFTLFAAVFLTYLFASVVPSFTISEVVVRSGFAVAIIGTIAPNAVGVIAATIALWILNIAFPVVVAVWFPWFVKKKHQKGNYFLGLTFSRSQKQPGPV